MEENGHAKLTDFGLSKEGVQDPKAANSFCGSVAYLAPEILSKSGHGKAVDWYLFGVLIYEMLTGVPPFFSESKKDMFQKIMNEEPEIPNTLSQEAADLLLKLLRKDPYRRLGSGKLDAVDIKNHPWFSELNWDMVKAKQYELMDISVYENLGNSPVDLGDGSSMGDSFEETPEVGDEGDISGH